MLSKICISQQQSTNGIIQSHIQNCPEQETSQDSREAHTATLDMVSSMLNETSAAKLKALSLSSDTVGSAEGQSFHLTGERGYRQQ